MTISRRLAWALLLLTVVGSSLIRQLHEFIPEWAPLPWPVRSPLYAFLVILFILVATGTVRARPAREVSADRLPIGLLSPLLLALVYEKVLSVTLYEALLEHAIRVPWMRDHLDAAIHLVIGTGMTMAVLLLLPLMRGVRIGDFIEWRKIRSGLYLHLAALIITYGILAGLATLIGGGRSATTLLFPVGGVAVLLVIGQGARAMSEEFYYRGLLQRELTGLMRGLGIPSVRSGQALAIALIAFGFGIEHFRFGAPLAESYRGFAYAMAVGCLFGYLLVLTRNIFFCGLAHATNNFITAGVMPRLGTPDQTLLLPEETVLYVYLVVIFVLVFMVTATPRGNLRRVFLPDPEPPVHA